MLTDEVAFERKTIPQAWSDEDKAELLRLRLTEGRDWGEIAVALGRTEAGIKSKFKYVQFERQRCRLDAEPVREGVPADVLTEQARRLGAWYRSQMAAFAGDPPVGFSALDRRLAEIS